MGKHSEKPELLYEIVEKASYPGYLEAFCRKQRKGWVAWGNVDTERVQLQLESLLACRGCSEPEARLPGIPGNSVTCGRRRDRLDGFPCKIYRKL